MLIIILSNYRQCPLTVNKKGEEEKKGKVDFKKEKKARRRSKEAQGVRQYETANRFVFLVSVTTRSVIHPYFLGHSVAQGTGHIQLYFSMTRGIVLKTPCVSHGKRVQLTSFSSKATTLAKSCFENENVASFGKHSHCKMFIIFGGLCKLQKGYN